MGRGLAHWKTEGTEPLNTEALTYAQRWIDEIANLPQSQRDWQAAAEEILHKYDIDYHTIGDYFNSLLTLPNEWWDHAFRSGLADNVDGGLNFYMDGKYEPI